MSEASTRTSAESGSRGTAARRATAVVTAAAAALALWMLAVPVAGLDLRAEVNGTVQPVGPVAVAAAGLVSGLAAWALLAVLERTVRRPGAVWTAAAGAVLVLSLPGAFANAAGTASMVTLSGLHLAVAAVLTPWLGRSARVSR